MNIQANKTDATVLPISTTRLSATEYNQIAASLMAILTAASVTPDAADNTQLVTAINTLIAQGGGGGTWGSITGTLSDQTDLQNALNAKQDTLTAGTGIDITGNVISATGGGSVPTLTWYTGNSGTTVTIADTSTAQLVKVYRNGILLQEGAANDYTISGTTLTLATALIATDKITTEVF